MAGFHTNEESTQQHSLKSLLSIGLLLYILPCRHSLPHELHPPQHERPLRVQIEGPTVSIERLLPHVTWKLRFGVSPFPQPAGPELAS